MTRRVNTWLGFVIALSVLKAQRLSSSSQRVALAGINFYQIAGTAMLVIFDSYLA